MKTEVNLNSFSSIPNQGKNEQTYQKPSAVNCLVYRKLQKANNVISIYH